MIIFLLIIVLVDNDSLNSLVMNTDNIYDVDDVNVLTIDYDKVVYNSVNVFDYNVSNNSSANTNNSNNNSNDNNKNKNVVNVNKVSRGWVWPTDANYIITTYYSSSHRALDISGTSYGSNIYAANSGVVSSVKGGCVPGNTSCNGRGGNYVVINHNNGYYTVYMHLKSINVSVGQTVSGGQVIGYMGNTGNVIPVPTSSNPYGGTHLHFCLYKGEPYRGGYEVNPMSVY